MPNSLILSSTEVFNIPLINIPAINIATIETNTKITVIAILKNSACPKSFNFGNSIVYSLSPNAS